MISSIYALMMIVVLFGLIMDAIRSGFCSVTTYFFFYVAGIFFLAAVLHPRVINTLFLNTQIIWNCLNFKYKINILYACKIDLSTSNSTLCAYKKKYWTITIWKMLRYYLISLTWYNKQTLFYHAHATLISLV